MGQVNLLERPEFMELVRRAWLSPVTRDDVRGAVPGVPDEQAWQALCAIRKATAFTSPGGLAGPDALPNWHNVPQSLAQTLHDLSMLTHAGSPLDRLAGERAGRGFITQQYVEEMQANLDFDGFEAEYEDLRSVLLGDRLPASDAERIAANYHAIMQRLGGMEEAPFDEAALQELYDQLLAGTIDAPTEGPAGSWAVPRSPLQAHYSALPRPDGQAGLELPVQVAAGQSGTPKRSPLMASMLVNCQFWRAPLFPACNNLMGCIASRFYLVREGFPVMRYVPKIRILEKWRLGLYRGQERCSYEAAMQAADAEGDWTLYYDTVMALMLHEVRSMERSLARRAAADDEALAGVERIPYLSHRQRAVLRQAVLAPETEFTIAEQKRTWGVAYSTARADLEKLADAGYLTRVLQGQAFAYRASATLRAQLA